MGWVSNPSAAVGSVHRNPQASWWCGTSMLHQQGRCYRDGSAPQTVQSLSTHAVRGLHTDQPLGNPGREPAFSGFRLDEPATSVIPLANVMWTAIGPGISANARRPDRPGNEFPGSSIGMSLRDSAPFADATSVLRPYDVSVPEGDIPMVEPGNSFPGRPWRRDAAGILDRPAIHIRFANGILSVAGAEPGHPSTAASTNRGGRRAPILHRSTNNWTALRALINRHPPP